MGGIVAGNGLGLFNASSNILGSIGVLGNGVFGQSRNRAYVNAATGNLILQAADEHLSGRGADLNLLRTYNSLGTLITNSNDPAFVRDVDGNKWQWSDERTVVFGGKAEEQNKSGIVKRTSGDGHVTEYKWVSQDIGYRSTEGDGAHDTVKFVSGEWVWIDGSTRLEEHYGNSVSGAVARLQSQVDASGNKITFGYDGTERLTSVVDFGSGQKIALVYVGTALDRVETYELGVDAVSGKIIDPPVVGATPIKQVEYVYDNGRIGTVKTILKPGAATATYYSTTYTYQSATSSLITNVAQSDGTSVAFTYYPAKNADGTNNPQAGRLWTVTDAGGTQTFDYFSDHTDITVTDAAGFTHKTILTFDASQRLLRVEAPDIGGTRSTTTFAYEPDALGATHAGNVQSIRQSIGGGRSDRVVTYRYDDRGNRIREFDSLGNTISRTYDAQNQLLTESHYKSVDANVTDDTLPADAMTTHFVYDDRSRLRFVVSAEGRVVENRYTASGLIERTVKYVADRYSAADFSATALAAWAAGSTVHRGALELCQYVYDFRGNLSRRIDFSKTNATTGEGDLATDAAATVTEYTCDARGDLLHTIAVRGGARDQRADLASFTYDGLGRQTQRIDASGTTTTLYNGVGYTGGANTIQVTSGLAPDLDRLTVLSTFDSVGRLTSVSRSGNSTGRADGTSATRTTKFVYDAQGRLALTIDPQGRRTFDLHDAEGRLSYRIDATGTVTRYTYNDSGQVLTEKRYINRLAALSPTTDVNTVTNAWLDDAANPTRVTKVVFTVAAAVASGVDLVTDSSDRMSRIDYDGSGRIEKRTDAIETVTTTHYDGDSRITDQQTGARITRFFYDDDGNRVGVVDPAGYLTESRFDAANRLVETIRYATRSPKATNIAGPVWKGITSQNAVANRAFVYRLPAAFDVDGNAIRYSVLAPKPPWLGFDEGSLALSGVPTGAVGTVYSLTLRATDGSVNTDVPLQITIVNSAPAWGTLPDAQVATQTAGFVLELPVASDNEGGTLTYSIVGGNAALPTGLSFDAATRRIAGTATKAGIYVVTARATDSGAPPLSTDRTFVLQVTNKGETWSLATPPKPPVAVRTKLFTFTVPGAIDPEGLALKYRIVSGPAWLGIDPTTHVLSGTPPVDRANLGEQLVVLEAEDPSGETARLSFVMSTANSAPSWVSVPTVDVPAGAWVDVTAQAQDPEGEALTYTVTAAINAATGAAVNLELDLGLHFDPPTGRLSGNSIATRDGDYVLTLEASDPLGAKSPPTQLVVHLRNSSPTYVYGIPNLSGYWNNWIRFNIPSDAFHDVNGDPLAIFVDGATLGFPPSAFSSGIFFNEATGTLNYRDTDPGDSAGATRFITFHANDGKPGSVDATRTIAVTVQQLPPLPPPPPPDPGPGPIPPGGSPQFHDPGASMAEPLAPIAAAPAPTFADVPLLAAPAPVSDLAALPPRVDALATWRPAADPRDQHSYFYYDGARRTTAAVDARGYLTETIYDERANTQQSVRYLRQLVVSGTDTLDALRTHATQVVAGVAGKREIVTTTFDSLGRVSTIRNEQDGTLSSNEYDAFGRLVRQTRGDHATDHTDRQTSRTRFNAFGEITGVLGGEGDLALLAAHPAPVQKDIDDALTARGTQYVYDNLGRRIKAMTPVSGGTSDTLFFYDGDDRLTHVVDALGGVSESVYDAFGEVTATRRYATAVALSGLTGGSNAPLLPLLKTNAKDQAASFTYERRGLLESSTDGEGFVTSNVYTAFGEFDSRTRTISKAAGTTPAQTVKTQFGYDADGRLLVSTSDAGGLNYNERFEYDAFGRVIRARDAAGKLTETHYSNDNGGTIEVVDPLNRSVRTTYDAFARVATVTDALGKSTSYTYDPAARSIRVSAPDNVSIVTFLTRNGQTASVTTGLTSTDTVGATSRSTYDADGRIKVVTDALGHDVAKSFYDEAGRLKSTLDARGVETRFTYDKLGRVVLRQVDAAGLNLRTQYVFDTLGQQVEVTEGFGTTAARTTRFEFDHVGRLTRQIVDPNGFKLATTFGYDGLGDTIQVSQGTVAAPNQQVTQYLFDKLGRRVKEIVAPSAVLGAGSARARDLTTEFRYDSAGRVSRRIDANGNSTWFTYDDAGQLLQTINALGEVTENRYDLDGRLTQTLRYVTRVSTAGFGDVASGVAPTPKVDDQRVYYVYDDVGQQRFVVRANIGTYWTITENRFDAQRNLVETRAYDRAFDDTRDPNDAAKPSPIDTSASSLTTSDVVAELAALYQGASAVSLARIHVSHFAYDAAHRLRFGVDGTGAVSENVYDDAGNVVSTVAYATVPALAAYDEKSINDAVNRANVDNHVTRFAYDNANRLTHRVRLLVAGTATTPPQQLVTRQSYDALNHLVLRTEFALPLGSVAGYSTATLDDALAAGSYANDVRNRITAYAFDSAGREAYAVRVLESDATSHLGSRHLITRRTYDALGHVIQSTAFAGQFAGLANYSTATLDSATNAAANDPQNRTTRFAFDPVGRLRFVVAPDGSFSETVYDGLGQVLEQRQFDALVSAPTPLSSITEAYLVGRRADRRVGDGLTRGVKYTRDAAGRVLTTTDAAGKTETNVYNGLGDRTSYTDRNGNVWFYGYDRKGGVYSQLSPPTMLQLAGDTAPKLQSIDTRFYLDAFGNLVKKLEAVNSSEMRLTEYAFDGMNRMTLVVMPEALVQLRTESAPASRKLVTSLEYDALGNLKARTEAYGTTDARTTKYGYDNLGRQTLVTLPGLYDPANGKVIDPPATGATAPAGTFQRTLETTYDSFDDAVRTRLRTGAGANDAQYEYKTYDLMGRVVYDVDALAHVTKFTYSVLGDQTGVSRYSVAVGAPASASGNLWTTAALDARVAADGQARTVTTSYDTMGRKVDVVQPGFRENYYAGSIAYDESAANVTLRAAAVAPVTHFDYDAFGDLVHEAVKLDDIGTDARFRNGHWRDTWRYFDALGREVRTIDAAGYQTAREFDGNGNLKRVTEYAKAGAAGGALDATGRLSLTPPAIPVLSDNDRITAFNYDAMNDQTSVQRFVKRYSVWNSAMGRYDEVVADRGSAPLTTVSTASYDSRGHVRARTDALGNVTVMSYDVLDNVVQITEPARLLAKAGSVDPFANRVSASPTRTFALNTFGQVVTETHTAGAGQAGATLLTTQTYDYAGNLIATVDAKKNTTNRKVDFAGRVIEETRSVDVTLMGWQRVMQTLKRRYAYDATGRQTEAVSGYVDDTGAPKLTGQRQVYDAFGAVTEQRQIFGADGTALGALSGAVVARYAYDAAGHVTKKTTGAGELEYFYDLAGQQTRQEHRGIRVAASGAVTAVGGPRIEETGYDILGHAVIRRLPTFLTNQTTASANEVRITPLIEQNFDRWGNTLSFTQGDFIYNGPRFTGEQRTTVFEYDADNHVVARNLPTATAMKDDGSTYSASVRHETHFDLAGRAVVERDVVNGVTELRTRRKDYDAAGALIAETDYETHVTSYAYDANGNKVGKRDALGSVFVDEFDVNGNLTRHSLLRLADGETAYNGLNPAGKVPVARTLNQYQYDQANRRVASSEQFVVDLDVPDVGRVPVLLDRWTYTLFDERGFGRKTYGITNQPPGNAWSDGLLMQECSYDALGNKTVEFDANRQRSDWSFSLNLNDFSAGRMKSSVAGKRTTQYSYDEFGQLSGESYTIDHNPATDGRAMSRTYYYNSNGWLREIVDSNTRFTPGSGFYSSIVDDTRYQYDPNGERTLETVSREVLHEIIDDINGEGKVRTVFDPGFLTTTRTTYDTQGRLSTVQALDAGNPNRAGIDLLRYTYDELGNRKQISAAYHVAGGGWTNWNMYYRYDRNDRMKVVDGAISGGLISANNQGATLINYDALGRRSSAEVALGHKQYGSQWEEDEYREERYAYDELGHLVRSEQKLNIRNIIHRNPVSGDEDFPPDQVPLNFKPLETRVYNLRGDLRSSTRQTQLHMSLSHVQVGGDLQAKIANAYRTDGRLKTQDTTAADAKQTSQANYSYDDVGNVTKYDFDQGAGTDAHFKNLYTYTYNTIFGGYKEASVTVGALAGTPKNGTSETTYDWRGYVERQTVSNPMNNGTELRTRRFYHDNLGQVLFKTEDVIPAGSNQIDSTKGGREDYFFAQGRSVAELGKGSFQTVRFDNNYTPISASYPASNAGSYVVNAGDTLASIAQVVFGDATLWYLIADANNVGFGPDQALPASEVGRTYRIPNVVANGRNNADTSTPYNAAAIIGSSHPGTFLPPPPNCDSVKQMIVQAVSVAISLTVTALLSELGPAGAAIGGASGDLAGQALAMKLHLRDHIDWMEVYRSGVEADVFAGFSLGLAQQIPGDGLGAQASRAGLQTGVREIYSQATNGFKGWGSWEGVGQSAFDVGFSMYSARAGDALDGERFKWGDFAGQLANGALNPRSGWLFNDDARTWQNITSQALTAFTQVMVGGLMAAHENKPRSEVERDRMSEITRNAADAQRAVGNVLDERAAAAEAVSVAVRGSSDDAAPETSSSGMVGNDLQLSRWEDGLAETARSIRASGRFITLTNDDYRPEDTAARELGDKKLGPALIELNPNAARWKPGDVVYIPNAIDPQFAHDSLVSRYHDEYQADWNRKNPGGMDIIELNPPAATTARDHSDLVSRLDYSDQVSRLDDSVAPAIAADGPVSAGTNMALFNAYELDRDAVASLNLSEINDAGDVMGGVAQIGKDGLKELRATEREAKAFADLLHGAGWIDLADEIHIKVALKEAREFGFFSKTAKLFEGLGKFADGVGVLTDFADRAFGNASPAQTTAFKVLDGAATAFLGYAIGNASPVGAGLDALQDKLLFGHKPLPLSDTAKGASSLATVLLEGLFTGEHGGVQEGYDRVMKGEYGWVLEGWARLGTWSANEGGGADIAWKTGQFWADAPGPLKYMERPTALGASVPGLGHVGDAIGRGVGWYATDIFRVGMPPVPSYTEAEIERMGIHLGL